MSIRFATVVFFAVCALTCSFAKSDLLPGMISDFQSGTDEGWGGGTVTPTANSGPLGAGDFSLQLANGGSAGRFAMNNPGVNGVISPLVGTISADIFRPTGFGSGEIRLVLFDQSGTRWTSTVAALIPSDGAWHNYSFSIQESNLTRVLGSSSYASLTNNLERIMFRHDPLTPSAGGAALAGTMNFDNIRAIPEPTFGAALGLAMGLLSLSRRRQAEVRFSGWAGLVKRTAR